MDLETAKLVAFALWAESYEGTTGKSPNLLKLTFEAFQLCESLEDLRDNLGEDLAFKLDNYLTVWETLEPEPVPPTEREAVEAVESRDLPEQEVQEITAADIGKVEDIITGPPLGIPTPKKKRK